MWGDICRQQLVFCRTWSLATAKWSGVIPADSFVAFTWGFFRAGRSFCRIYVRVGGRRCCVWSTHTGNVRPG